ncbi:HD domain-containing protein [soil metagenome]
MSTPTRATYRTMAEGTAEDYARIAAAEDAFNAGLVPRVLGLVEALAEGEQAYPISRLDQSLQSATRAFDDGRSVDYVVAALLHDIGDTFAPHAHGAFAAAVIAPYVPERVAWIVKVHPEFQQYYYAPHMGGVRDAREKYRGHRWFDDCVEFCEKYDQNCFDAHFEHRELEFFRPMVEQVFAREPWGVSH